MSESSEAINNFFNFDIYDQNDNKLYYCNNIVIYKNELYKSLINDNNRNPHDTEAWFYIGTLADIINYIVADDKGHQLDISYYPECSNSCVAMFNKGQCVIDKVIKTDALGIPLKDDCGNVTYDYLIFNSLTDCNTTPPLVGSQANPPTWSNGMTTCEYLNRSVGYTQDGDTEAYQVSPLNRLSLLSTTAPDNQTLALTTVADDNTHSNTVGNKLRVLHDLNTISLTDKGLSVNTDVGLSVSTNGIAVKPADKSLSVTEAGVKVELSNGLELSLSGVQVKNNTSLTFDNAGAVGVKAGDNSLTVTNNGLVVKEIGKDTAGNPINAGDTLLTDDTLGKGLEINPITKKIDIDVCDAAASRTPDKASRHTLFCDKDGLGKTPYEHCDYPDWVSGRWGDNGHHIVKGSDGKYYLDNQEGFPDSSNPVTQNQGEINWFGGYSDICTLLRNHLGISNDDGNLLQLRKDGFYYGSQPPPQLATQYVDAVNGIDDNFTTSGAYRGNRDNPLKTIHYALSRLPYGSTGTILLHESQDHLVNTSTLTPNNITFIPYGSKYDELSNLSNPDNAHCPGNYTVLGSYRYRDYKPKIIADKMEEYDHINLTETLNALTPAQSFKFTVVCCVLVTTSDPGTLNKPYIKDRVCFGSYDGQHGVWYLIYSEIWLADVSAFNGDFTTDGTFYLKRLDPSTQLSAVSVKSNYMANVTFPVNIIDRPALPAPPLSNCDVDYYGIQLGIDIDKLFSGYGASTETIIGLNTSIPINLIKP